MVQIARVKRAKACQPPTLVSSKELLFFCSEHHCHSRFFHRNHVLRAVHFLFWEKIIYSYKSNPKAYIAQTPAVEISASPFEMYLVCISLRTRLSLC